MNSVNLDKLHVKFIGNCTPEGPAYPRKYTLTHSDRTGELFLSIGTEYDHRAISGWYTRLMRDEVLAAYQREKDGLELHVFCHVSGGIVIGGAAWRYEIFKYHLPGILAVFRYGDAAFISSDPAVERAPIRIHFNASNHRFHKVEQWGTLHDYTSNVAHDAV